MLSAFVFCVAVNAVIVSLHHWLTESISVLMILIFEINSLYLSPSKEHWCLTLEKTNKQNKFFVKFDKFVFIVPDTVLSTLCFRGNAGVLVV